MFDLIKKILKNDPAANNSNPQNKQERTKIAAAVLLLEAAHIDNQCTEDELKHVIETLRNNFSISESITKELIDMAQVEKSTSVDLWEFTNQLNKSYAVEEKIMLLESVWRIIFMDGRLDKHEDQFAHRLANLLRLSHRQMIDAKIAAKGKKQPA